MTKQTAFIISVIISLAQLYAQAVSAQAQYIKHLDSAEQTCLDKGDNMLGCTLTYYHQMDSMLNVTYKLLKAKADNNSRIVLRKEQRNWLSKRDKKFKEIDKGAAKGEIGGSDAKMIATDKKAAFVRERVMVLIQRYEKK